MLTHGAVQILEKLMRKEESDLTLRNAETILKKEEVKKMIKTFTKFNEDEELSDFEEDLIVEKLAVTADAMKRYKAGKAWFTDKAHLKAKGLIEQMVLK